MDRREFLCGLAGVGCTSVSVGGTVRFGGRTRRTSSGIVALELRGKFRNDGVVESADEVGSSAFGRLVTADLDCEDDWGDLNPYTDRYGRTQVEYGNDETGYWHVARAYEFMEPSEELHEGRVPVWYEITLAELAELVAARLDDYL